MQHNAESVAQLREAIELQKQGANVCVPATCVEWAEGFTAALDWVLRRLNDGTMDSIDESITCGADFYPEATGGRVWCQLPRGHDGAHSDGRDGNG